MVYLAIIPLLYYEFVIIGIGIDVQDINRLTRLMQRTPNMLDKFLSKNEKSYSEKKIMSVIVSKEALLKATSSYIKLDLSTIQFSHHEDGKPYFMDLPEELGRNSGVNIFVSISHSPETIVGIVIVDSDKVYK